MTIRSKAKVAAGATIVPIAIGGVFVGSFWILVEALQATAQFYDTHPAIAQWTEIVFVSWIIGGAILTLYLESKKIDQYNE